MSSIAILLTLVYLAIQTQQVATQTEQNTAAIIANSRHQSLDAEVALLLKNMEFVTAETTPDGDVYGQRLALSYSAFFRIREVQWLQYRDGLLDEETWSTYMTIALIQLTTDPFAREFWETTTGVGIFIPGFVEDVNQALSEFSVSDDALNTITGVPRN